MSIDITLTVPTAHASRVLNDLKTLSGKNIDLMVHGEDFDGNWSFVIAAQETGETDKQFAGRAIRETVKALVRLVDYAEDHKRYSTEVAAIAPPVQDVPDEILE